MLKKYLLFGSVAFVLASCGGDSGPKDPDPGPTPVEVKITLKGSGGDETKGFVMAEDVVSDVTESTARIVGTFANLDPADPILDHGHVWSSSDNPTLANTKSALGARAAAGSFGTDVKDLEPNKTYFVRSYITTKNGTAYLPKVASFTTKPKEEPKPQAPEYYTQKVMIEQVTGGWCGWCPVGKWQIKDLMAKKPGTVVGVAIHYGDPLENRSAHDFLNKAYGISGYPGGMVNRVRSASSADIMMYPTEWPGTVEKVLNKPKANVGLSVKTTFDAASNRLTVDAKVGFGKEANPKLTYYVTAYLLEDDLAADQANYLSGDGRFKTYEPYYSLPGKIAGYKHNEVLRRAFPAMSGEEIPKEISTKPGSEYTGQFQVGTSGYASDKCSVVVFITSADSPSAKRRVENVQFMKLGESKDYD
ncbi:MAG: hypothetical protein EAZ57_00090 [Cytophagales bacterium]|nr:MAG: hypothetical protein EAZ67_04615 [Cytophagales bacterium]TAF62536.1 MAG: hypothetical protein EAZ57_00090 [Cytophagales bacterium]